MIASAAVIVLSGTSIMVFAKPDPIKMMLNGTEFIADAAPLKIDDTIMMPLKEFGDVFGKQVTYDNKTNTVDINDQAEELIAESEDKKIVVSGDKGQSGIYEHLKLKTPVFSRSIPGYNVVNPNYLPFIETADMNGDGVKEIVILLTTGYGTGVYESNVLIYASQTGDAIPVEDAHTIFLKKFNGKFTDKGAEMDIDGEHYSIPLAKFQSDPEHLSERPGIGSIMQYDLEGGILTATTAVQISPAEFIGDLKITYSFKNGLLQGGDPEFTLYPEYSS